MSIVATLFIIGSGLGWGGFDLTRKKLAEMVPAAPLAFALTTGLIPLFFIWAAVQRALSFSPYYWAPGLCGVTLNLLANLAFIRAIAIAPLSLTVPYASFTPVFMTIVAVPMLDEWPTWPTLLGIIAVVSGAFLLYFEGRSNLPTATPERKNISRGRALMLFTATLWAFTLPIDKIALRYAAPPMHALFQAIGVTLGIGCITCFRGQQRDMRKLFHLKRYYLLAVLSSAVGLALQLVAIQFALVSIVESAKRAIGLFLSVVNGRLFFDEPITRGKLFAVVAMSVGVALILL